jgi:hypothetical protein
VKRSLFVLAAVLFAATLFAKDKKPKQEIPDEILNARYVAVIVFNESNQLVKQADDLRAIGDVEQALRKWGRYAITLNVRDADFVIAIRKGRMAEARIGVPSVNRPGISTETEIAPPGDMFAVYRKAFDGVNQRQTPPDPRDAPPVWRIMQDGILDPPVVSAVLKFKKAVEDSEKVRAARP